MNEMTNNTVIWLRSTLTVLSREVAFEPRTYKSNFRFSLGSKSILYEAASKTVYKVYTVVESLVQYFLEISAERIIVDSRRKALNLREERDFFFSAM